MDLEKAESAIKIAWIAGLISGVLTLIFALIPEDMIRLWALVDVLLIFGLTFGIYKRSRVCSILMLLYFVFSKLLMWGEMGRAAGLPIAMIFGFFFFHGIRGTFAYHKIVDLERSAEAEIPPSEGESQMPSGTGHRS